MTDRDNITLPREVVQEALEALEWSWGGEPMGTKELASITALRTALAAPKQEPVAYFDLQKQVFYWSRPTMIDVPLTVALEPLPLYAAPPEDKTHPGYVIGSHWLETAYSRVCAGEAEADVLRDIGLVRITDGMVETADIHAIVDRQEALRRENERLRDELRQSSIDYTRAEVERLRELLTEVRGAKWLVVQNNLLDRIDAALRREEP